MSPTPTSDRAIVHGSESGFTLAGLLVIMTVIMIFIAFTVPKQWSMVMQRERDKQTIFVMKQYAEAITTYQQKHGGMPTSLDQLKEARNPRLVRGPKAEWADPLTGKVDWILVPPGAMQTGGTPIAGTAGGMPGASTDTSSASTAGTGSSTDTTATVDPNAPPRSVWERPDARGATTAASGASSGAPMAGGKFNPQASPKDYVGPFIGVRPAKTGKSFIALNGAENYEEWAYTIYDLQNEINARNLAMNFK